MFALYSYTLRRKILHFTVNIISLEPSTTRILNVEPYNTLTITCTASSSNTSAKTFTWIRQKRGTFDYNELTPNNVTVWIVNTNLEQQVSTSVLTVKETLGVRPYNTLYYYYRCRVDISDIGVSDSRRVGIQVTGESYGFLECSMHSSC